MALTKNNDSRSTIANFLVLCSAKLNHALGGRVGDFDFSEDGMAVVCENDAAHGVEQHLKHGLGAKT